MSMQNQRSNLQTRHRLEHQLPKLVRIYAFYLMKIEILYLYHIGKLRYLRTMGEQCDAIQNFITLLLTEFHHLIFINFSFDFENVSSFPLRCTRRNFMFIIIFF